MVAPLVWIGLTLLGSVIGDKVAGEPKGRQAAGKALTSLRQGQVKQALTDLKPVYNSVVTDWNTNDQPGMEDRPEASPSASAFSEAAAPPQPETEDGGWLPDWVPSAGTLGFGAGAAGLGLAAWKSPVANNLLMYMAIGVALYAAYKYYVDRKQIPEGAHNLDTDTGELLTDAQVAARELGEPEPAGMS